MGSLLSLMHARRSAQLLPDTKEDIRRSPAVCLLRKRRLRGAGVTTTYANSPGSTLLDEQEIMAIGLSLISCGLFIYLTIEVSLDNTSIFQQAWVIYIELLLSIFAVFDYLLLFFLAETKYRPLAPCTPASHFR